MAKKPTFIDISFCVSGHAKQTIQLDPDCSLTPEQIVKGLNDGDLVTTIQEDGEVQFVVSGQRVGKVTNVDNHCEYTEFDLDHGKYQLERVGKGKMSRIVDVK